MPGIPIRRPLASPHEPAELRRARREAERQLAWAEAYLAAAEGIETGDPFWPQEVRRLRLEVARLREQLRRPRVV